MNIASVIVDVPALGTDREFDYLVPDKWIGMIEPGMRVAVPFGPRTIQGFVTGIKDSSDFSKLKEVKELLDLTPVLNKELLELGGWLAEETLSFKISAFHAMLPAAMKAKYEKSIRRVNGEDNPFLDDLFNGNNEISWKDAENKDLLPALHTEIKNGNAEVIYYVKNRARKKTINMYQSEMAKEELNSLLESLRPSAEKQKQIIEFFILHPSEKFSAKQLIEKTGSSQSTINTLIKKGVLSVSREEIYRDPYEHKHFNPTTPLPLTVEQKAAITPILNTIDSGDYKTFLLYGVTGSGKTEIYLQSIQNVLDKGKEAIVLVPEIALTPQMVDRFKSRFGDDVAVLHSALSTGERYDEWRKVQRKEAKVVVGARSAIFAPFENLGIIIIDEEHETSYKQEEAPRYHARDVAIQRAKHYNCPVILGSATPSLESFARAKKEVYHLLTLSKRMNNQALPAVSIVDMREEMRGGNRSMFSRELFEKLEDRLAKKEQTILFLNRRGHSSFMMCRDCGYVMQCPHCDISLTYHRYSNQMKCHYCGFDTGVPEVCPECTSNHIRYFGTGTQKVEEELNKILPEARIVRMDVDTTGRKGAHEKLLDHFKSGNADILLGTQMIAKGLDFPNITLVGVLSADTMLHLPDFRAGEKTFQLLTQVSGRAGRHELLGEVVIQTYTPEHYSVEYAGIQDYDRFYRQEMMMRKIGSYPPFFYLTMVTVSHEDLIKTISTTEKITKYIQSRISNEAILLGPVASPIPRINDRYRYQCLIKYKQEPELKLTLKKVMEHYQQQFVKEGLAISIDVNPYMMM
ncbi:primosomal protein N' [Lederbergia citrea]|uniref:Replication restart protein PriA n=1 Tax=Lederbergia citrea TaxID=2833581 RepID=A0A942Z1K1_9BACI|nr:primosomal protein N' [Lederbergia citrea]MBS4177174.1 primosomal protein N' [Lederbergia citrea]MBS4203837.1 primosomal protein N' [Lederbergia citrea]MBS4221578.1 primosomal protein N' [Lederbergia citrea]